MNYVALLKAELYEQAIEEFKKTVYLAAYRNSQNNQSKAAKKLNVSRTTFISYMKKRGLL